MSDLDYASVDRELREIAAKVDVDKQGRPITFFPELVSAPVGSAGWWEYASSVLCAAHNTRKIDWDTRNRVLEQAFDVWQTHGAR